MLTILAKEWMESGEAGDINNNGDINAVGVLNAASIVTNSTVRYKGVTPDNDGMFLRVDTNGNTYAFRVQNQDTEWIDSRTDAVTIDSTERVIAGVTVNQDIQQDVGSWSFAAKIDAETRFDTSLTLTMKVDGAVTRTKTIQIQGDETGYPIATWDDFAGNVASGASCVITATSDRELTLRGDLTPTTLKVVHQNSAPVSAMATAEKALLLPPTVVSPTKQDFLDALGSSSQAELIGSDFTALSTNGNDFFQVFYSHQMDEFFSHPIVLATDSAKPTIAKDEVMVSGNDYGNGLSRAEIEADINDAGYEMPTRDVTFFIQDAGDHVWFVRYFASIDKFAVEKLKLK